MCCVISSHMPPCPLHVTSTLAIFGTVEGAADSPFVTFPTVSAYSVFVCTGARREGMSCQKFFPDSDLSSESS